MAPAKHRVQTRLKVDSIKPGMEQVGPGVRGSFRVDIGLVGSVHLEELGKLLDDEHASNMFGFLFDSEGELKTPAFGELQITTVVKDATIKLGEGKLQETLKDCLLDCIVVEPKPGRRFDFWARIRTNPSPKQQSTIEFEFYKDTVKVIVDGGQRVQDDSGQEEMPLEGGDSDKDGEGSKERETEGAEA